MYNCCCCFKDECKIKLNTRSASILKHIVGEVHNFDDSATICSKCELKLEDFNDFRLLIIGTQRKFLDTEFSKSEPKEQDPVHTKIFIPIKEEKKEVENKLDAQQNISENKLSKPQKGKKKRRKEIPLKKDHFCIYCDKYFTESRKVNEHIKRIHLRKRDYQCDYCGYSAFKKYDVFLHITNMHKPKSMLAKIAVCPTCGLAFSSNSRLNVHVKRKHLKSVLPMNTCDICSRKFATISEIRCHMKTHLSIREQYKCEFCEAKFASKGSLKTHRDVKHLTPIEISCFCGKVFKQKSVYQRHYDVIHLGHKTFQCKQCDKAFAGKTHLTYHERAVHATENSVSFPCEICGNLYKSLETLKRHRVYHSPPTFKCNQCGKLFHEKKRMLDHQSVHMTLNYPCAHCKRSFRLESQYNYHLKKVHFREKQTFRCELCLSIFSRKSTYRAHAIGQHKELSEDSMAQFLMRIKRCLPEEHKSS